MTPVPSRLSRSHNDGAEVVQVIRTTLSRRGDGRRTPLRVLTEYWSLDGELLAEADPLPEDPAAPLRDAIQAVLDLRGSEDGRPLVVNHQARDLLTRALQDSTGGPR